MNFNNIVHIFFVNKQILCFTKTVQEIENEAIQNLNQNQNDIQSIAILGQLYLSYKQDQAQSLKMIKKGLLIDSQNLDLRLDLLEILLNVKQYSQQDFISLINECYQIDKDYWRCDFLNCFYYHSLNNLNQHRKLLEAAYSKYPDNQWIKLSLAQQYSDIDGEMKLKAKQLLQNSSQDEKMNYSLLGKLAVTNCLLGDHEFAEKCFQKAYELNPKSYKLLNNFAQFERLYKQNYQKSIEYSKLALQLEPTFNLALLNCAVSYNLLGNNEEFLKYIKKCLIQKKSKQAYQQLVSYYWKKRDKELSIYYSKQLLRMDKQYFYAYYTYFQIQIENICDLEEYEMKLFDYFNHAYYQVGINEHILPYIRNQTLFIYQ